MKEIRKYTMCRQQLHTHMVIQHVTGAEIQNMVVISNYLLIIFYYLTL